MEVVFDLDENRKIANPEINYYAKSQQRTAEILEAFCCLNSIERLGPDKNQAVHECHGFESGVRNPDFDGTEISKFRNSFHLNENSFVVIHKIPLSLLVTHKGLFLVAELTGQKNLISVPVGKHLPHEGSDSVIVKPPAYVPTIIGFYQQWSAFLENSELTKEMVIGEAVKLTSWLAKTSAKD